MEGYGRGGSSVVCSKVVCCGSVLNYVLYGADKSDASANVDVEMLRLPPTQQQLTETNERRSKKASPGRFATSIFNGATPKLSLLT